MQKKHEETGYVNLPLLTELGRTMRSTCIEKENINNKKLGNFSIQKSA